MSLYLSRDELAELVGCDPRSKACMRKWLDKRGWPYVETRSGFPQVSRKYHDDRLAGTAKNSKLTSEPDFSSFRFGAAT